MSRCFLETNNKLNHENSASLFSKQNPLTCITCHNPHVSVKFTNKNVFNNACKNCHGSGSISNSAGQVTETKICSEKPETRNLKQDNCISCHMPSNHTTDIPHVMTTDHFIRIPLKEEAVDSIREFLGIVCINNSSPPPSAVAEGYLSYFEKFTPNPAALDSAKKYLDDDSKETVRKNFPLLVRWAFLKQDYSEVIRYVKWSSADESLFKKTKFNNDAAWTAYRVGESFSNLQDYNNALKYLLLAVKLEPYNPEFRNKLGALQLNYGNVKEAAVNFEFNYKENPKLVSALTNMGFYYLSVEGNENKAEQLYKRALLLDPDNEQAMLNMAGLFIFRKEKPEAKKYLEKVLKKYPGNIQALEAMRQISSGKKDSLEKQN